MARCVANPPNPWASTYVDWLGDPPIAQLQIFEEEASSLLSANDSPDIPFRWSINPYRGCFHGCAYCYARPSHQYLGQGEAIHFSGNTDCYQPLEAAYGLTRRCLDVCLAHRNPVTVVTKGNLIRRDVDLLAQLSGTAGATVHISIPFADPALSRALEPYAAAPDQRLETIERLAAAGVPTGVMIAPIIPGLNDREIPTILAAAAGAGAITAAMTLLRLPREVLPVFRDRLEAALPERAGKVWSGLREMRDGQLNDGDFGTRMHGRGPRWQTVRDLFALHCRRLGLVSPTMPAPRGAAQADLFPLLDG